MANLTSTVFGWGKAIFVPSTVLVGALAVGVLLLWSPWQRLGQWLTTVASVTLFIAAVGPLSTLITKPLELRFPPSNQMSPSSFTGIVVLGGAFDQDLTAAWSQPQLNNHAERLIAFVALAQKYPNLQLIFSGGSPGFSGQTEADTARDLFASLGLNPNRILFENRSLNTCENAIYTAQLVRPTRQQTWMLVTSAMDMPRAIGAFRKAGFRVLAYPVDYTTSGTIAFALEPSVVGNLGRLDHAAHEWLGLLAYHFLGCTDSLFPRP
jgi:uncharacterized SAM-binding protein YcdF (DUF218 family)